MVVLLVKMVSVTSEEDGNVTSEEDGSVTSKEYGSIISEEDCSITSKENGSITSREDGSMTRITCHVHTCWNPLQCTMFWKNILDMYQMQLNQLFLLYLQEIG